MADPTVSIEDAKQQLHEIIRTDLPFEKKTRDVLELGTRCLEMDQGFLTQIDQLTEHWETTITTETADRETTLEIDRDLNETYCRQTIGDDTPLALHDAADQGWADDPAFEISDFDAYLGVSLLPGEELYGTVCFVAEQPRSDPFSDAEIWFAEHLARLLERELEREVVESQLTSQTNLATVLNRVLRHNLRNDISVIRGHTELIADQLDDNTTAETVLNHIDDLLELSEKARELEEIISASSDRQQAEIGTLVADIVENIADGYPTATISVACDDEIYASTLPNFGRAIEELIENALKHGGDQPTIAVEIEAVPNAVEIRIQDDGPGLPDQEAKVLTEGEESPLIHGSGLGLWLAHWIISNHDGSIEPSVTENGTTMVVSFPQRSAVGSRKQLTELARSRDKYKASFEQANDAIVLVNDAGRIMDANATAGDLFGVDTQGLLGRQISSFLSEPSGVEPDWAEIRHTSSETDTISAYRADTTERVIEYSVSTDVVPGQHLFISRDVTEREKRERELQTKTRAMDKAPIGITLTDPAQGDNPMIYTNTRFCELSGYEEDEILGRNCRFMQGDETDSDTVATIRQAIDAEETVNETIRNYRKDGTPFWNRVTIAPVTDETGNLTNWVGFQEDVTDRIEREQALEETTQRLQAVIDASPDAIVAVDGDGRIQLWNDAATALFGCDADAVIGEPIQSVEILTDDQQDEFERQFKRALAGETPRTYEIQRQTDGSDQLCLRVSTAPITDESGTITGVMGVVTDLTGDTDASATGR